MAGHIASAGSTEWRTPGAIIGICRAFFRRGIDLDPCAQARDQIAATNIVLPMDGLKENWTNAETIFVNPPYGTSYVKLWECISGKELKRRVDAGETKDDEWRVQKISMWVEKAWQTHCIASNQTILLIPATVDTALWQQIVLPYAMGICFIKGRVKFEGGAKGPAPMACALVYFGERGRTFRTFFSEVGRCLLLP